MERYTPWPDGVQSPAPTAVRGLDSGFTLDQLVVERGLAPSDTLARARLVQSETGEPLDTVLTRLGMVSEQALARAIAEAAGLRIAGSDDFPAAPVAADRLSPRYLRDARAIPLKDGGRRWRWPSSTPWRRRPVTPWPSPSAGRSFPWWPGRATWKRPLDRLYPEALAGPGEAGGADEADVERLKDLSSDAPVVRAVNALIAGPWNRRPRTFTSSPPRTR